MKKRTWRIEEKVAILKEVETGGVVETCRKHDNFCHNLL
jgi:transposase-like protein